VDQIPNGQLQPSSLVIQLAGFVLSSTRYLFSPSMYRFPVATHATVQFELVNVVDSRVRRASWQRFTGLMDELYQLSHISFGEREITIQSDPLFDGAIAASKRVAVASYVDGKFERSVYLDENEMFKWLSSYAQQLHSENQNEDILVVPIFLFQLYEQDAIFFANGVQATEVNGVIFAIQTNALPKRVDFQCSGPQVSIDPTDAMPAIFASVLQSVWGVCPTHLDYSFATKKPEESMCSHRLHFQR
jgi:hypothetical protein